MCFGCDLSARRCEDLKKVASGLLLVRRHIFVRKVAKKSGTWCALSLCAAGSSKRVALVTVGLENYFPVVEGYKRLLFSLHSLLERVHGFQESSVGSEPRFEVGQGEKAIAPTLLVDAHEEVHWFSSGFKFIKAFVRNSKLLWPCSTTPNLCVFEGMRERSSHPALHGGLQAAAEVVKCLMIQAAYMIASPARVRLAPALIIIPRHLEDDSNVIFSRVEALSVRRGEDLLDALRPTEQFNVMRNVYSMVVCKKLCNPLSLFPIQPQAC